jgi:acetylglutamate kinase
VRVTTLHHDGAPANGARPWAVKIGGRLCEDPATRAGFARACAALDRRLVVIHGGGAAVTRLQQRLGLEARFVDGRRVTTDADLEAVEMVLGGNANPALVRALSAAGLDAVGLSGCDAGFVRCRPVVELGRVGTPERVEPSLLRFLLGGGYTPVVSPVSPGPDGTAVNVNADELACSVAGALRAERLLLLSNVEGVQVDGEWRGDLRADEVEPLIAQGTVTGGMIPKLRAAAAAVAAGVDEVRIAGFDGGSLAEIGGTRVRGGEHAERSAAPAAGEAHAR